MASSAARRRATVVEVTDPQRGGYFDPLLSFRVNTRSPLPEYVSVARTGMDVRCVAAVRNACMRFLPRNSLTSLLACRASWHASACCAR
jgi:hypothetical protein